MLKKSLSKTIIIVFIIIALLTILVDKPKTIFEWLTDQWIDIVYAAIWAIVAGVLIHFVYIKISPKPIILENTMLKDRKPVLAKLILPNNSEIKLIENEKIFGRENFFGVAPSDDIVFIGKKHFKITKIDNIFYLEDLDSVNGTKLNGEEIKGLGRKELKWGDEILVADVLKISYEGA